MIGKKEYKVTMNEYKGTERTEEKNLRKEEERSVERKKEEEAENHTDLLYWYPLKLNERLDLNNDILMVKI